MQTFTYHDSDELRKEVCEKSKGFRFWFVFSNFPVIVFINRDFRYFYNFFAKKTKKQKQKNTKKHANIDLSVFLSPTHIFSNLILKLIS